MSLASNEKPKYAITPWTGVATLSAASAGAFAADTNGQTVYTAPSAGARCDSLMASSNDTSAVNLFIYIKKSGGSILPLGIVNVPATSGAAANVLNVDCLDPNVVKGLKIDGTGKRYIDLANGDILRVSVLANMTAAKTCTVTGQGADYA